MIFPDDPQVKKVSEAIFDPFEYLMLRHKEGKLNTEFKTPLGKVPTTLLVTSGTERRFQDQSCSRDPRYSGGGDRALFRSRRNLCGKEGVSRIRHEDSAAGGQQVKMPKLTITAATAPWRTPYRTWHGRRQQDPAPMSLLRKAYGI